MPPTRPSIIHQFFMEFIYICFYIYFCFYLQRPPSSSLSYGGAMNDDARSPGAGSTPGPLSQQPPALDTSDPGKYPLRSIKIIRIKELGEKIQKILQVL